MCYLEICTYVVKTFLKGKIMVKIKERIVVPSGEEGGDARGMERYTTVRNVVLY